MRRVGLVLAGVMLLGSALAAAGQGGETDRVYVVGAIGGAARAVAALPDGAILAEGDALLRLAADGRLLDRVDFGRGAVADVVVRGGRVYALAEEGLIVTDATADAALPRLAFVPGGGQALAVTGDAVYAAAQQAGLRVIPLSADGLPTADAWRTVAAPGRVVDVAVDLGGRALYAALGVDGAAVYTLSDPVAPALAPAVDGITAADALTVADGRLLIITGHRVTVFALDNPLLPVPVNRYAPLHDGRGVILRGEWAYAADAVGGLYRFSVADLAAPRFDRVIWPGVALDVVDDGRYFTLAAGWDGVIMLDAGLEDAITVAGQVVLPGEALAVAVAREGDQRWGVAAMGADGLAVLDLRDPAAAGVTATLAFDGAVSAVALRETIGFAAVEGVGLVVISLADLSAPRVLATVPLDAAPESFTTAGTLLYAAAGQAGLYILETIRPAEPAVLGRLLPPDAGTAFHHVALENGKRAFLSTGDAVIIADVDRPEAPRVLAAMPGVAAASVARNFIVYAVGGPTFRTINVSSSSEPRALGLYQAVDVIRAAAGDGGLVWLAGSGDGARAFVLDAALGEIGPLDVPAAGRALAVGADGAALLVTADGGLFRLGETVAPLREGVSGGQTLTALPDGRLLLGGEGWQALTVGADGALTQTAGGSTDSPQGGYAITAVGERVFLALGAGGVQTEDGAAWMPDAGGGSVVDLAAGGGFLFAAERGLGGAVGEGALRVLMPAPLGSVYRLPLPGEPTALSVSGDRVYAAYTDADGGGLAAIEARTPSVGLAVVGTTPLIASDLALREDVGLVYALAEDAITVLDTSTWPQLSPLRTVRLPGPADRLARLGSRWLAAYSRRGLVLLDARDPASPAAVAVYPGAVDAAAGTESALYVASPAGLDVLDLALLHDLAGSSRRLESGPVAALWMGGGMLYAAGADGLAVYDLADPLAPVAVERLPLAEYGGASSVCGRLTRRDGVRLLVVTPAGALRVSHDAAGLTVGEVLPTDVDRVFAAGDRWWVARSAMHGLRLMAADGPVWFDLPLAVGNVIDAVGWGERLLVAGQDGLAALAHNPAATLPAVIGAGALPERPLALAVGADAAWLGTESGVWRVNLDTLAAEFAFALPGVTGVALAPDGSRLAVGTTACGVYLYDVGDGGVAQAGHWAAGAVHDVAAVGEGFAAVGEDGLTLLGVDSALAALPQAPVLPSPPDGADDLGAAVTLSWGPASTPCQPLRYEVWAGVGEVSLAMVGTVETAAFALADLPPGATVRWQVHVIDAQGDRRTGPVWTFSTQAVGTATPAPTPAPTLTAPSAPTPLPTPTVGVLSGFDAGAIVPLLIGGVVVEMVLVVGLWRWWRRLRG